MGSLAPSARKGSRASVLGYDEPYCRRDSIGAAAESGIGRPVVSRDVQPKGRVRREFRAVPIGHKPVTIAFPVPRGRCQECGRTRQVRVAFADPRRSYTHAFERYALELSRDMTIQDVAEHLGVGWDLIKDLQKRHLQRRFARPKLESLRKIGKRPAEHIGGDCRSGADSAG